MASVRDGRTVGAVDPGADAGKDVRVDLRPGQLARIPSRYPGCHMRFRDGLTWAVALDGGSLGTSRFRDGAVPTSDTWQDDRPPAMASDLAVCLDQEVAIGFRVSRDGAEGPVLADHEVTGIRTAARAGGIARQRPRVGDDVHDL